MPTDATPTLFRFEIGMQVKPRLQTNSGVKYVVVERWLQECAGGQQRFYDLRFYRDARSELARYSKERPEPVWEIAYLGAPGGSIQTLFRLTEGELEAWTEGALDAK